jgi:hypothetical protein
METIQDDSLATKIGICGSCMRFFLNSTTALAIMISFYILLVVQPVTPKVLIIASMPIGTAALFFIIFLRLLKQVENFAADKRDIDLASRAIWELNKSFLIRLTVGRIPTFIKEK